MVSVKWVRVATGPAPTVKVFPATVLVKGPPGKLIAHPKAKDGVGEMGVHVDLPRSHSEGVDRRNLTTERATRTYGVEVAEVHVKAFDSVGPTGEIRQLALRTGAHHPTGVDIRMIEGLVNNSKIRDVECARAPYIYLAIG
jgi:hypothetical protein